MKKNVKIYEKKMWLKSSKLSKFVTKTLQIWKKSAKINKKFCALTILDLSDHTKSRHFLLKKGMVRLSHKKFCAQTNFDLSDHSKSQKK